MDDYVDEFALRVLQNNKYARTTRAVEKSMQRYGITRPLTVETRKIINDLPKEPNRREDEIMRRLKHSKFPKTEHEVPQKLNDLYVYTEIGKALRSDAITHTVMKSLKIIEDEIPPPDKRQVAALKFESPSNIHANKNRKTHQKVAGWYTNERTREDLNKYSQVGEAKRKLYSMPEYIRNRDRKGVKLPEAKLKSPSQQMNLNISTVRGSKTKMGRVIVKQEAKLKKVKDLKHQLNPFGKKLLK